MGHESPSRPSTLASESDRSRGQRGTIYTFYSYKGGVGRSMALANVAALLGKWGHRCLIVDWDLEAPGIEGYFKRSPSSLEGSPTETSGLMDLILAHKLGKPLDWRACLLTAHPFQYGEPIKILSAGRRSEDYSQTVQNLNWGELFERHDLGGFLEHLREEWAEAFEFVLIDSRTGINDIGGICTVLLPDVLVLFFTTNEQSINGVIDVMHAAREARRQLPVDRTNLVSVPVPARDESVNEYDLAQEWRNIFAARLKECYWDWIPKDLEPRDILDKLYIPYVAIWSFGERLPVAEKEREIHDPRSISAAYAKLATLLAHRLDWGALDSGPSRDELVEARAQVERERVQAAKTKSRALWISISTITVSLLVVIGFYSSQLEMVPSSSAKAPKILNFSVFPPEVFPGREAQLCYGVVDARDVRIDPGVGEVKPVEKKCLPITPTQTTTYKLTATGLDGLAVIGEVTVTVLKTSRVPLVVPPKLGVPAKPKPK